MNLITRAKQIPEGRLSSSLKTAACRKQAFTLTEFLVTMAVSLLISLAVVASQLFGMRMTELTQTKIHSSDKARQINRLLTSDIQSARAVLVGTGSSSSFTEAPADTPQQGNSLQIYPSDDPNIYVRYFRQGSDLKLRRKKSDGSVADIASGISNAVVFSLENFSGNVLAYRQNNAVVGIDLQFMQLENPDLTVGPGQHYKSYRFRTRVAQPTL